MTNILKNLHFGFKMCVIFLSFVLVLGCLIGTTFFPGGNEVLDDASDVVESDGEDEEDEDDLFEYMQDVEDDQDQRGSNRFNKQVV